MLIQTSIVTKLALHRVGGLLDGLGVGDVEGQHERAAAERLDAGPRALQPLAPAGDERDGTSVAGKPFDDRAAEPGRRAGDDDDFRRF